MAQQVSELVHPYQAIHKGLLQLLVTPSPGNPTDPLFWPSWPLPAHVTHTCSQARMCMHAHTHKIKNK